MTESDSAKPEIGLPDRKLGYHDYLDKMRKVIDLFGEMDHQTLINVRRDIQDELDLMNMDLIEYGSVQMKHEKLQQAKSCIDHTIYKYLRPDS